MGNSEGAPKDPNAALIARLRALLWLNYSTPISR